MMSKTTKIVLAVVVVLVLLGVALTAVSIFGARHDTRQAGQPATGETQPSGSPSAPWVAIYLPVMMPLFIIALTRSETWPVTQSFSALRYNRPERREGQVMQYVTLRFSGNAKFARFSVWAVPKGEKTKVVKEGDQRMVVVTFPDGSEYTFSVVKRAKDDPKGTSGYAIDDVRGGEFDALA